MDRDALKDLISSLARRDPQRTESDLQADVKRLLLGLDLNISENDIRLESPMQDGSRRRLDIEVGMVAIETKRDLKKPGILDDAIKQLYGYVKERSRQLNSRYLGILTDGAIWNLYELAHERLEFVDACRIDPEDPNIEQLHVWLEVILATQEAIKPTPDEITRRLGVESPSYIVNHNELSRIFDSVVHVPEVALKRKLWAKLLRTAVGAGFSDDKDLFIDHTLLVLQANLIAHAILGFDLRTYAGREETLVHGSEFKSALIGNVVEADFFDWFMCSPAGPVFVSALAREIRRFQWAQVEHDVLKVLYESVITPGVRKSLGEYYTPDWLAQHIVDVAIRDPLHERVLDPACGSGTFLFHAVRRYLSAAEDSGLSNAQAIKNLENQIFGIDVHPVSVQLARVTYLLAIGLERLTREDRPAFSVPVYLGDSLQWENTGSTSDSTSLTVNVDAADLTEESQDTLFSIGERLSFPLLIVNDPGAFDRLVGAIADKAQSYKGGGSKKPSIEILLNQFGIAAEEDRKILRETFSVMCDLNAQGRNHIWGYYVRNLVRPLWFALPERQVDVLIGNPPWVAYRFMTEAMQSHFQRLSKPRRLTAAGENASNQDLVGLFIARTVELYLREHGRFAFVAPRSVLSRPQYAGFRKGSWGETAHGPIRAKFERAWDLDSVQTDLFPVPSAVLHGTRSDVASPLPSEVRRFAGKIPNRFMGWDGARKHLKIDDGEVKVAASGVAFRSPYGKTAHMGATIRPQMFFFVLEKESGPLGSGAGRVKVESLKSTLEKAPWKNFPPLSGIVERVFVQNILLGSTILPFRVTSPRTAVVPIVNGRLLAENEIQEYSGLEKWWKAASRLWDQHKGPKNSLTLMERLNYQNGITGQIGKGIHRVVYNKSGSKMAAARLEGEQPLVEQSLYWLNLPSVQAAQFITGILNSTPVRTRVSEYQSRGLFGARDFAKLVWHLPIPYFNNQDSLHLLVSDLAAEAEEVAASTAIPNGLPFARARNLVRDALKECGLQQRIDEAVEELLEREERRSPGY